MGEVIAKGIHSIVAADTVQKIIDEIVDNELLSRADKFYASLVGLLHIHGMDKMGVKTLPEGYSCQDFLMWAAMLDEDELHNVRSYFFDRWNFETNCEVDKALLKILDGWEDHRKRQITPVAVA